MAVSAISAFLDKNNSFPSKPICTFVLAGGCNLSCAFCAVRLRDERKVQAKFCPEQYENFLLSSKNQLSGVAIVGDEPLLPEAWKTTRRILDAARYINVTSAIVTNGTHLEERAEELSKLAVGSILVSVDGPENVHDKIRGRKGTFREILSGFTTSQKFPELHRSITLASILLPNRISQLGNLIEDVLLPYDIKKWVLSPLLSFERETGRAKTQPNVLEQIATQLPLLVRRAQGLGIEVCLDDSFNLLPSYSKVLKDVHLSAETKEKSTNQILRIVPDGTVYAHGDHFANSMRSKLKWNGTDNVKCLLQKLSEHSSQKISEVA